MLDRVAERAQTADEVLIQTVGDIQTQAVDVKFLDPAADALEQVLDDLLVAQIQLDQLVVTFPALVPEAVVVVGIAVEIDVEPVLVRGVPLFLLNVLKCPEAASDMVEHAVEHDADAFVVQDAAHFGKLFIGAEAAVDFSEIAGVVAVAVGFKDGGEIHGIAAG